MQFTITRPKRETLFAKNQSPVEKKKVLPIEPQIMGCFAKNQSLCIRVGQKIRIFCQLKLTTWKSDIWIFEAP